MSLAPRSRVALLTAVVVLAVVQPALAGVERAEPTRGVGDVGLTVGAAVERHPSSAGATAEALRTVRADAVHDRGLTGAGVSVGVIGQGFDAGGAVAPHVAAERQVGDPPRSTAHDTAVAEVVSETAPDADLYLAGVGRTPTPAEYAAAVEWLTARGADIIVDSGSYFPSVAADERRITAAAERAIERGVVFVTSAGNYADRHWAGTGTAKGWVTFAADDAANALADGERLRGRVTVRLRWHSAADYDLYLYRRLPDGADRVVAKSVGDETGPGLTVESIDVAVPRGRYYVGVYADSVATATDNSVATATDNSVATATDNSVATATSNGVAAPSTPATDPGRVQVFAAHHRLEHTTAHGSMVAPATSDRVVAVGAAANGEPLPYSSLSEAGSVDLTAPADARTRADPTFVGTSAAAPYVAGTAALVEAAGRDPSPARIEAILERTADDEGSTVDALAAVEAASASGELATAGAGDPDGSASATVESVDDAGTWPDVTASPDPDRGATDSTTGTSPTRSADESARNVTRPDDGRRSGVDDARDERNRDDDADRSPGRDRDRNGGNTTDDGAGGRERRDGTADGGSRER
ncbi:S8 family serine peptidase [Haloplanus natans]|uniref:S8 family serine peptidase n=1 Tax=Haloplanus natans TaxID=376171 RepID=UPI0006777171|nr:S8 family serine peptidase [Haloplanus natans]